MQHFEEKSFLDTEMPVSKNDVNEEKIKQQTRNIVLRQLAAAPKTRHQLAEKLASKEIPADIIETVLDRFEEVQLIDDAAFAEMWVRSRHRSRGLARTAIQRELSQKGVERGAAEEALEQISDEDEWDAAVELVEKKTRRVQIPETSSQEDRAKRDKLVRRLVGMLARRGYKPSLAFSVVDTVLKERQSA